MNWKSLFSKKRLVFIALFLVMVFIGKHLNFSPLVGADNQFFTLFQFFGPIAGAFLGPWIGVSTVLGAEVLNLVFFGSNFTGITLLRLLPMLFAAYYFGTKRKHVGMIVPALTLILFWSHPVGRQAWIYPLYWFIPIIITLLPKKYKNILFLKSLGATFTAHAAGSAIWIYTVPMPAEAWIGLIPIVAYERALFALGITGSYLVMNIVLDKVIEKFKLNIPHDILHIDKQRLLSTWFGLKKH